MGLRQRIKNLFTLTPSTPIVMIKEDGSRVPIFTNGDYSALYSIAYMACQNTKARSLGSLPVGVYNKTQGKREEVSGHPLARLLSGQANDMMSGRDLRHWISVRRDTFGNAFVWVEWHKGEPVALWPITAAVTIDYNSHARAGKRLRYIVSGGGSKSERVPAGKYFADEVINIRTSLTQDGVTGMSVAEKAAKDIGLSIDLEEFYASMLKNGNHQLGHVELPDNSHNGLISPEAKNSIERAIADKTGPSNAGKAPIFAYGAKWITDQQTMRDAALIEQQTWVLQQVCRACSVPPAKVFDLTKSTYSNAEMSRIDYATDTMAPEAADIETAFRPVLDSMGQPDYYLHFDLNGLMRGDVAARGQFYREMVYMGAMTRNEVRAKEEMNPIDGLDRPLIPVNYGIVEEDGSVTVLTSSANEPADGMQTNTTDKEA